MKKKCFKNAKHFLVESLKGVLLTKGGDLNLVLDHRYLRKADCSSFDTCLLLALPLPKSFLCQPLTVLTRQTRQAVHAINTSILLRCLWFEWSPFKDVYTIVGIPNWFFLGDICWSKIKCTFKCFPL
jgi:hypothetical protein